MHGDDQYGDRHCIAHVCQRGQSSNDVWPETYMFTILCFSKTPELCIKATICAISSDTHPLQFVKLHHFTHERF